MAKSKDRTPESPDETPLTKIQAERLSAMTDLPAAELVGIRPSALSDGIKGHLEPHLWGYRRVCHANSRAFNPSGYVAGYQTNDWLFDIGSPPIYDNRRVYFSGINA